MLKHKVINSEERILVEFVGERGWSIFNRNMKGDENTYTEEYMFTEGWGLSSYSDRLCYEGWGGEGGSGEDESGRQNRLGSSSNRMDEEGNGKERKE